MQDYKACRNTKDAGIQRIKEYNYAGRQRMKKYKGCRNTKDVEIQRIQEYK